MGCSRAEQPARRGRRRHRRVSLAGNDLEQSPEPGQGDVQAVLRVAAGR